MSSATNNEAKELSPKLQRYVKIQVVIAIVAAVMTIAIAISIFPLLQQRTNLKKELSTLQGERNKEEAIRAELKKDIENLEKNLKNTFAGRLPEGKRKKAVELALELKPQNIPFTMGGRKPETGLDLSGFILYTLSGTGIEIFNQEEVRNYNQSSLMNKPGVVKTSTIPETELRPGDIIFYEYNLTLMYLGCGKCIGMMYENPDKTPGTIEIKDINFARPIGYWKVPYGD